MRVRIRSKYFSEAKLNLLFEKLSEAMKCFQGEAKINKTGLQRSEAKSKTHFLLQKVSEEEIEAYFGRLYSLCKHESL